MTRLRTTACALALSLVGPPSLAAPWQRRIAFAKGLGTRRYLDLADLVLRRIVADGQPRAERPAVLCAVGDCYADLARDIVAGRRVDRAAYIRFLQKANAAYEQHNAHAAAPEAHRVEVRGVIARISLVLAEVRLQLAAAHGPGRAEHRASAARSFDAAIAAFRAAEAATARQVDGMRKAKPTGRRALARWRRQYEQLQDGWFRLRLQSLDARVRRARLLMTLADGAKPALAELARCEQAYIRLLLDMGARATVVPALHLGICLLEQGPARDRDALERFANVWHRRAELRHANRIPCEAAWYRAIILKRQGKLREAIAAIDELLVLASAGAWRPDKRTASRVVAALEALEGAAGDRYSQRDAANALMLQAEAIAALAAAEPGLDERRRLYASAYAIASAVDQARATRDPARAALIERWWTLGELTLTAADLRRRYLERLAARQYLEAARLGTRLVGAGGVPRPELRATWLTIGRCYYQARRFYQAALVFAAVAHWFPTPSANVCEAVQSAIAAQAAHHERTGSRFDARLLLRLRVWLERLRPEGSGGSWATVAAARLARQEARFADALALLARVGPNDDARADALHEAAATHKARVETLPAERWKGDRGKRLLAEMLDAFHQCLGHYRTARSKLRVTGSDDSHRRLVAVTAASLALLADAHLRPYLDDPRGVIQLTDALERQYPGITDAPAADRLYVSRMRAADLLITRARTVDDAARAAPIVDEAWAALRKLRTEHAAHAARIGSHAHLTLARKLRVAGRVRLADAARRRAADYDVELLRIDPDQTPATWRRAIEGLSARGRPADHETIITLIRRAPEETLVLKAAVGLAHHARREHAEAIPHLEQAEARLETLHQDALETYRKKKRLHDENPELFPHPPQPPRRRHNQPEIKEKLADCYLVTDRADKYAWTAKAYDDLIRIHAKHPAKLWGLRHKLLETWRRQGRLGDVLRLADRFHLRDPAMGGRASAQQFRRLVARVVADVETLDEPPRKALLLPLARALLRRLSRGSPGPAAAGSSR